MDLADMLCRLHDAKPVNPTHTTVRGLIQQLESLPPQMLVWHKSHSQGGSELHPMQIHSWNIEEINGEKGLVL